ncbi:hypothetical protein NDU88_004570 [Pleurodeles waltl]|uniref:Uncharacterized protein n=1 Tax=Pleurodeles waltl TaxID=8319 RepID=A0AAV7L1T4_PLEWA|nr:hypothetical protein NDU88_004570 [Pleurodeles waltl]
MCRSTAHSASRTTRTSETQQIQAPGEALGGRLRHWGRAALELRQVRRGSARIPLWRNPGRVSTGKAPGKEFREPDSATTRFSSPSSTEGGKTSKVVGAVGARGTAKLSTDSTTMGLMFKIMASRINGASTNFMFKFEDPKFFKKIRLKIMRGLAESWYHIR